MVACMLIGYRLNEPPMPRGAGLVLSQSDHPPLETVKLPTGVL